MTRIGFIFFIILLAVGVSYSQKSSFCEKKSTVVEAFYIGAGMSGIKGKHLISRVCSDGTVQYEDVKMKGEEKQFVLKTVVLPQKDLQELLLILKSDETKKLFNIYEAYSSTIDHSEDLIIRILGEDVKEIQIKNFKPDIELIRRKYPLELLTLACSVNKTRLESELRFFFREDNYCL